MDIKLRDSHLLLTGAECDRLIEGGSEWLGPSSPTLVKVPTSKVSAHMPDVQLQLRIHGPCRMQPGLSSTQPRQLIICHLLVFQVLVSAATTVASSLSRFRLGQPFDAMK
jgi:hypothetical protein